jgi:hypothetical protein
LSQPWWHRPEIPALRRLRQEDPKFKANLGYTARLCLKKKKEKKKIYTLRNVRKKDMNQTRTTCRK